MNRISKTPQGQGASSCKHDPHQRNLGVPGLSLMSAPKTSTEIQTPKRKRQKRWKIDILDIRNIGEIHPKKIHATFWTLSHALKSPSHHDSEDIFTGTEWTWTFRRTFRSRILEIHRLNSWAFYVKMSRCQATLQGASLPNCHHHPENTRKWCEASHPST